ncbi:hypothetical protein A7U60_g4494 [Sanghuangporus baumii]|uniref:Uncharacterized protein n=1 Tax=Sanghuangporus baumii TaxID=108892 RepID=A0A9Q5HYN8_SANBA|nr:hypothetical protein A7U60_g4494 [Sanghuangporus baumii]
MQFSTILPKPRKAYEATDLRRHPRVPIFQARVSPGFLRLLRIISISSLFSKDAIWRPGYRKLKICLIDKPMMHGGFYVAIPAGLDRFAFRDRSTVIFRSSEIVQVFKATFDTEPINNSFLAYSEVSKSRPLDYKAKAFSPYHWFYSMLRHNPCRDETCQGSDDSIAAILWKSCDSSETCGQVDCDRSVMTTICKVYQLFAFPAKNWCREHLIRLVAAVVLDQSRPYTPSNSMASSSSKKRLSIISPECRSWGDTISFDLVTGIMESILFVHEIVNFLLPFAFLVEKGMEFFIGLIHAKLDGPGFSGIADFDDHGNMMTEDELIHWVLFYSSIKLCYVLDDWVFLDDVK